MVSRLKIGTKIALSFALGLAVFAAISASSYHGMNQLIEKSRWEAHSYSVLSQLKDFRAQINAAESGQRGYIITGRPEFLEPYNANVGKLETIIQQLRQLTTDNPAQQQRLNQLEPLVKSRIEVMQSRIDLRRESGFQASQTGVKQGVGFQLSNQIEQILTAMEQEEQSLLDQRSQLAQRSTQRTLAGILYGIPAYSLLLGTLGFILARNISRPLQQMTKITDRVGEGDLSQDLPFKARYDEIGTLNNTIGQMIIRMREATRRSDEQNWLSANLAELTQMLQGQRNLTAVARAILSQIAPLVDAQQGVFYQLETTAEPPVLKLLGSYAYQERKHLSSEFRLGEGLVGQCALEKQPILLTDVPHDYIRISSGLGETPPLNIIVLPVIFEDQVTAVIELASLSRFQEIHLRFLNQVAQSIGIVLSTISADVRTNQLLVQSQVLTQELQNRQMELEESNLRLEEQTKELRGSEALLKEQQEELQQTNEELQQLNEELEEKAELLALQKRQVEQKNQEIELARQALYQQAEELALSSKYKSEFLANMSHELRTPLNSLLILARLLADNSEGNLTDRQVEYSHTIYAAGTDLLELINDILDLAKIESGMMSLNLEAVSFGDLQLYFKRSFEQMAADKGLRFEIVLSEQLPPAFTTDAKRLQQILRNLLSNAFKFTEQGSITLRITPTSRLLSSPLSQTSSQAGSHTGTQTGAQPAIAFAVEDTGIGIAPEKQKIIFEAFQQADGTTSRKYGGTGLGLSISRELAHLLGGQIELTSQPHQGSTFTLYLPLTPLSPSSSQPLSQSSSQPLSQPLFQSAPDSTARTTVTTPTTPPIAPLLPALTEPLSRALGDSEISVGMPATIADDRNNITSDDRVLLIIEDDVNFARILLDMAHKQGFKAIVAVQGGAGLALAQNFRPAAIMLDLRLPDMDGWTILDRLKHDPNTRHIPVHILSIDEEQQRGLQLGAIAYSQKPVSVEVITQALTDIKGFVDRRVKQLLVIEDDAVQAQSIIDLIGNGDVRSTAVYTGAEALDLLQSQAFDCIVLDLGLPDMSGFELLSRINQNPDLAKLPIIVYTGKDLSRQEETELRRFAETIIIKDVRSPERLLDETALFLHRVQANLPQPKRNILEQLRHDDPILANKKVLIVDDDVRNIFALTGLLERYLMEIIYAENGRDGIATLEANPDVDIILMDVMMPEMDGYETTQAIRQKSQFQALPIIALTAKAMQGDREKCLEAGASDYIMKPVDTEQLLSLLRVWLYGRD